MIKQFKTTGTVFLLLFFFQTYGQGPGYLGKHVFLSADLGSMVALSNPTANNRGFDVYGDAPKKLGFNTSGSLMLGYAVSRRHVLFADMGYFKTGMPLNVSTPSLYDDYSTDEHYLFYNLSVKSTTVGCQWYNLKKGALAPLGNYFSLNFRRNWVTGEVLDKRTDYAFGANGNTHAKLGINPSTQFWSVGIEGGQHFIIFDKLLLNFSVAFDWPLGLTKDVLLYDESNQRIYKLAVKSRYLSHNFFIVKLGAGYLLF